MNARKQRFKKGSIPNRSNGQRSPLDRLPSGAQRELLRRCLGRDTYKEIAAWLARKHGLQLSQKAIFSFRKRHIAHHFKERQLAKIFYAGGFEIAITIRVTPEHSARKR